jgi:adenylosuccinate synthase
VHWPAPASVPDAIDYVLGICKAYATRVGGGPFPTELNDEMGEGLRKRGNEFGATTGRPRRCGWIDLVALKRAVPDQWHQRPRHHQARRARWPAQSSRCASPTNIAASKRDLAPLDAAGWDECKPVYLEFPGWSEPTQGAATGKLPPAARAYLRAVEELAECHLALVATGADRDDTIILRDPVGAQERTRTSTVLPAST